MQVPEPRAVMVFTQNTVSGVLATRLLREIMLPLRYESQNQFPNNSSEVNAGHSSFGKSASGMAVHEGSVWGGE
jgi:hypothetical protein